MSVPHINVEPDVLDGGFVSSVANLPGCMSQGATVEEAVANAREAYAEVQESRLDHAVLDSHTGDVESGQTTPQAVAPPRAAEAEPPAGSPTSPPANVGSAPTQGLPVVDPLLFVHATAHGDLEQIRIASQNRLRILTTTEPDDDGVHRGFGLDPSHPDVARLQGITDALTALEHGAELNLKRALRKCGIHPWVKAQVGLGEKQVARLLGAIGDPYWHLAEDRPRTVSELWAYCGLHVLPASPGAPDTHRTSAGGAQTSDPGRPRTDTHTSVAGVAAKRRKGQRANWSTDAKTRAYLVATSCIKQARSPYRAVYDTRRAHTAATHTDWTAGHSHNDALRITSKAILRDLWRESKRLHEAP